MHAERAVLRLAEAHISGSFLATYMGKRVLDALIESGPSGWMCVVSVQCGVAYRPVPWVSCCLPWRLCIPRRRRWLGKFRDGTDVAGITARLLAST